MALWQLKEVDNCIPYDPCQGVEPGFIYNPELITPPRRFEEAIWWVSSFYYVPSPHDLLCLWAVLSWIKWPGWRVKRYDFAAGTGELKNVYAPGGGLFDYIDSIEVGGYGKHYASFMSTWEIKEVSWESRAPITGGFEANLGTWLHNPIVNRQDEVLGGTSSWHFEVWDYAARERLWLLRLPTQANDAGWENRERCWLVLKTGQLLKINYQYRRVELMTSVAAPLPDDKGYFCAFDQLRDRLAIFRHRPDAEDGACESRLEFYRPVPKAGAILTEPVPISSLRVGRDVTFVSHLTGDVGEGLGSYLVEAPLAEPALGKVLGPAHLSGQGGQVQVRYKAPTVPGTDILKVRADISEGG